jgi:hypothetical protein
MKAKEAVAGALQTITDAVASNSPVQFLQVLVTLLKLLASDMEMMVTMVVL